MTNEEYKTQSVAELESLLAQYQEELGGLAFNEEARSGDKRKLRKKIARVKTFLRQQRNKEE